MNSRSCYENCKPNLLEIDDNNCYFCDFNEGKEYYIIKTEEIGKICETKGSCDASEKIVENSKQCASQCNPALYQLGDYCLFNVPQYAEIIDKENKICKY